MLGYSGQSSDKEMHVAWGSLGAWATDAALVRCAAVGQRDDRREHGALQAPGSASVFQLGTQCCDRRPNETPGWPGGCCYSAVLSGILRDLRQGLALELAARARARARASAGVQCTITQDFSEAVQSDGNERRA